MNEKELDRLKVEESLCFQQMVKCSNISAAAVNDLWDARQRWQLASNALAVAVKNIAGEAHVDLEALRTLPSSLRS